VRPGARGAVKPHNPCLSVPRAPAGPAATLGTAGPGMTLVRHAYSVVAHLGAPWLSGAQLSSCCRVLHGQALTENEVVCSPWPPDQISKPCSTSVRESPAGT